MSIIPASDRKMKGTLCDRLLSQLQHIRSISENISTKQRRFCSRKTGHVESSFEKKSCPIDNTRKMWKIDMPPLIAKIRHDAFVKMKNCGHYICRKLSQLRTYQNLKENQSIFTEIQSIFQKYANVIICKFKFLSSEAIMMTSWVNWGSNETWNHISDS